MSRSPQDTLSFARRPTRWGLALAPRDNPRATRAERQWRWPTVLSLTATIPAFYAELLQAMPTGLANGAYLLAAAVLAGSLWQVSRRSYHPLSHLLANPVEVLLILGLLAAALLPASNLSPAALGLRLAVSFLTLLRMVWAMKHLITRGGLAYMLLMAVLVLAVCGLGFWWLEPTAHSLSDGLWLAFTTAATVGFGDMVPTTAASKIFSVFVVLLGYGTLSLVTAAIATSWVETEERRVEREIMRDMRREVATVRDELAALRRDLNLRRNADHEQASHAPAPRDGRSKRKPV
jgi:voltage-gated potassium channel